MRQHLPDVLSSACNSKAMCVTAIRLLSSKVGTSLEEMQTQFLTASDISKSIQWMSEVCYVLAFPIEIQVLSFDLLHRMLSVLSVQRSELQLVSAACLLISSKMNDEACPVSVSTLCVCSGDSFSSQQLRDAECFIMTNFSSCLFPLTSATFLELFSSLITESGVCTITQQHLLLSAGLRLLRDLYLSSTYRFPPVDTAIAIISVLCDYLHIYDCDVILYDSMNRYNMDNIRFITALVNTITSEPVDVPVEVQPSDDDLVPKERSDSPNSLAAYIAMCL
ncbi:hypothetical protein GEMRC1_006909 [Eukaryota sp. GEM-RC1]